MAVGGIEPGTHLHNTFSVEMMFTLQKSQFFPFLIISQTDRTAVTRQSHVKLTPVTQKFPKNIQITTRNSRKFRGKLTLRLLF